MTEFMRFPSSEKVNMTGPERLKMLLPDDTGKRLKDLFQKAANAFLSVTKVKGSQSVTLKQAGVTAKGSELSNSEAKAQLFAPDEQEEDDYEPLPKPEKIKKVVAEKEVRHQKLKPVNMRAVKEYPRPETISAIVRETGFITLTPVRKLETIAQAVVPITTPSENTSPLVQEIILMRENDRKPEEVLHTIAESNIQPAVETVPEVVEVKEETFETINIPEIKIFPALNIDNVNSFSSALTTATASLLQSGLNSRIGIPENIDTLPLAGGPVLSPEMAIKAEIPVAAKGNPSITMNFSPIMSGLSPFAGNMAGVNMPVRVPAGGLAVPAGIGALPLAV
jgi:hypothetical protein